jgi:hypothetical protein
MRPNETTRPLRHMVSDMKIGVLSDTHGRTDTVAMALAEFRARSVELVIHCGDVDDAETVKAFAGWNVHFVFGNCDSDRAGIRRAIEAIGGKLHEPFGHLELAGKQLAWLHGDKPDLKHDLETSGGRQDVGRQSGGAVSCETKVVPDARSPGRRHGFNRHRQPRS